MAFVSSPGFAVTDFTKLSAGELRQMTNYPVRHGLDALLKELWRNHVPYHKHAEILARKMAEYEAKLNFPTVATKPAITETLIRGWMLVYYFREEYYFGWQNCSICVADEVGADYRQRVVRDRAEGKLWAMTKPARH